MQGIRAGGRAWCRCATAVAAGLVLFVAGAASAAPSWRIEAGSANSSVRLNAVSCVSATVCVAVGDTGNIGPTSKIYAESRSGTKWSVAPSSGPAGSSLFGVSCVAADWCASVGWYGYFGGFLTEHWDGRTWSQVASPQPSGSLRILYGVSCTSRKWCVAVGDRLRPDLVDATMVEHWNGTKWTAVPSPNRGTTRNVLQGVSCVSPSWCAAVGTSVLPAGDRVSARRAVERQVLAHRPESVVCQSAVSLATVDCVSSTWCIAVGGDETGALIERWDGRTWTMVAHPTALEEGASFGGVSCVSRAGVCGSRHGS